MLFSILEEAMRNSDSPQGLYSPLSQMVSDSDSDAELQKSSKHSENNQQIKENDIFGETNKIINMQYNNSDCEEYGSLDQQTDLDNVAIIQDGSLEKSLSSVRKCFFIFSLLICILTVIIFLWVIPCSSVSSCPSINGKFGTQNWVRDYDNIELKGLINAVNGGRGKNLIFMYRGDKTWLKNTQKSRKGIIALIGNTGQIAWYDEMRNEPLNIDCTLLDADKNGVTDCLVIAEFGQLGCMNPISGQWMWVKNIYDAKTFFEKADLLDFPLILPDLNKDGVNDLLFVSSLDTKKHNHLVLMSGSSGERIGSSYVIKNCTSILKLQVDNSYNVRYNCWNNGTEIARSNTLIDLYELITGIKLNLKKYGTPVQLPQHKYYSQRKNIEIQRTLTTVSGKQLLIENKGKCPVNCTVYIELKDTKKTKDILLWKFTGSRMYGMVPVKISFNNSNVKSKSMVHGFVMKLWEWSENETEYNTPIYNSNTPIYNNSKRTTNNSNKGNNFSNMKLVPGKWVLPDSEDGTLRRTRSAATNSSKDAILNSKIRFIKETIVLIVFNSTDTKIENTSQSNIIQFCNYSNHELICQPDLNYHENSILITDLDDDGNQELLSYYTSYYSSNTNNKTIWKLKSYVQLLRLQSELPKLYTAEPKN